MSLSYNMAFSTITEVLDQLQAPTQAAEAHGLLSGLACAGVDDDLESWLEVVLGAVATELPEAECAVLSALRDDTLRQLDDEEGDFDLLIPSHQSPLILRARALSEWCRGFLAGLGLSGLKLNDDRMEVTRAAVARFVDISRLDHDSIDITEADEAVFEEIVLYVRERVLAIYDELTLFYASCMEEKNYEPLH